MKGLYDLSIYPSKNTNKNKKKNTRKKKEVIQVSRVYDLGYQSISSILIKIVLFIFIQYKKNTKT